MSIPAVKFVSFSHFRVPGAKLQIKYSVRAIKITEIDSQIRYDDEDEDEGPQPDPMFEQGAPLPVRMHNDFPPELASTPLEDIDSFYFNKRVFFIFYYTMVTHLLYNMDYILYGYKKMV